jgi:predicted RNase H-like HicB family nuclease
VELEQEEDGRWIAEVTELPGVLAYGDNPEDARAKAQELALRVVGDSLEHSEAGPDLLSISFKAAGVNGEAYKRVDCCPLFSESASG